MSIYKRGGTYWFNFVFNGVKIQRSTKVSNRNDARDIERAYWNQLARGAVGLPTGEPKRTPPTIAELLDALQKDYELRSIYRARAKSNFKGARAAFPEQMKASSLTTAMIDGYIEKRLRKGLAHATVNRVVGLVASAYKKAVERGDIDRMPKFSHLSESGNARQGFFSREEFDRVYAALPADLADFALFCFLTAWRKGEAASLQWADLDGDTIRLRGENAKNGSGRSVVIAGELTGLVERRRAARLVDGVLTNHLFHREGQVIAEFRKTWASACVAAGVGVMRCRKCNAEGKTRKCEQCEVATEYHGKIFHDLRRSGVRHMVRSGVPQSIAMRISGHKTTSMFRRYDICDEGDLRSAIEAVQRYHQAEQSKVAVMKR